MASSNQVGAGIVSMIVLILIYIGSWIYIVNQDPEFLIGSIAWSTVIVGTLTILGAMVYGASRSY